MVKHILDEA